MSTNQFFDNYSSTVEQSLHSSLIVEAIQLHGMDMYYLPRTAEQLDYLHAQDPMNQYSSAFLCEFYIKNVEGFEGEGDFLSKFNLQIRDQTTFTVARLSFANNVGTPASLVRPREGDLLFFPLNKKFFQIKFVEHESMFYPLGELKVFDLKCELFEHSGERFATGNTVIDAAALAISPATSSFSVLTEKGLTLVNEAGYAVLLESWSPEQDPAADTEDLREEADGFLDFSEGNPFGDIIP